MPVPHPGTPISVPLVAHLAMWPALVAWLVFLARRQRTRSWLCSPRFGAGLVPGWLLAAMRGSPRARMPVRGRGRADGGAALAVHRVELVHPRAALAGDSVQRDDVLRPSHSALRRRGWRRR